MINVSENVSLGSPSWQVPRDSPLFAAGSRVSGERGGPLVCHEANMWCVLCGRRNISS